MRTLIAVIVGAALTGCATPGTKARNWRQSFVGQPINKYIEATRIPDKQHKLDDQRTMYQWDDCYANEGNYNCHHRIVTATNGVITEIR